MKIITVCGSLKYKDQIMKITEEYALRGNCMLSIVYPTKKIEEYTKEEIELLGNLHKERIKISDAILVADIDNYIGKKTQEEIALAKSLNKEIIYYNTEKEKENDYEFNN